MHNKKLILIVSVFIIIVLGVVCILYILVLREPKAIYVETNNKQLDDIRLQLEELKAGLRQQDLYKCCIRNDCNWCAIYMGHCNCVDLVTSEGNEKSCPECAAAWNRKQGKIPGITPDAIQVTTFGIYGYEKDGHHYHSDGSDSTGSEKSKAENSHDNNQMPHKH